MDYGINQLKHSILEMGNLSQKAVTASIEAYQTGKGSTQVYQWAEQLKVYHHQVSDLCIELIARYQPVASDLRFVKACFEISYGFFRYGRYAHDINQVMDMFGDLSKCDRAYVVQVADKTQEMIKLSIDAFTNRDVELAGRIKGMDDYVDDKYEDYVKKVIRDPATDLKCAMSSTLILRYLERIADHATYIADSVVYISTGEETPL